MDAAVTYEIAEEIEKDMVEFGVKDFYYKYVHPLIPILLKMQIRGVKIDQVVRAEAYLMYEKETIELQEKLDGAVGRAINVNSSKQMQQLLYIDLKLPTKYKRGTTNVTANEEALQMLAKQHPSPIFDLILSIRHNRKLMSTYLVDKGGKDGRIRCSYVIGGTETGRLSSRKSVFGTGTNLQNIPKGICRKMFVPDAGNVFIEADLSQAEARVVAYLSEEDTLIDLFNREGDVHSQNASRIFNKKIGDVSLKDRDLAKKLVHASNYGIGPRTFGYHAGVGEREAKVLLQKYFDTYPKIKAWQFAVQGRLRKSRTVVTPLGRKRTFFGRWNDKLYGEAYAFVPQGTVGDILNLAIIRFSSWMKGMENEDEVEIMLQNHDAVLIQCNENKVEYFKKALNNAFDIPVMIRGRELIIPVKFKVGPNWNDMEKLK